MSSRTLGLSDALHEYLLQNSLRETALMARLREETARLPMGRMQISPEQGQFMALLLKTIGARRCIEVGTFTGYSALVCASALPPGGLLVACDVSESWTAIARRYWQEAGIADRISLRLAPARQTLQTLLTEFGPGTFDFMFIDADKTGYRDYYESGLALLRAGGVVAFDNVLWSGAVADPSIQDDDTRALRELNRFLQQDSRVDIAMLPIGDGLTLARKC